MSRSAGPVILAGSLAAANEALFTPLSTGKPADWAPVFRLVPVTAGLALGLSLLEKAVPEFATGLAWLLVAGVFIFPVGHAPSLLSNVNSVLRL